MKKKESLILRELQLVVQNSIHSLLNSLICLTTNRGLVDWFLKITLLRTCQIIHQRATKLARYFSLSFELPSPIRCSKETLTSLTNTYIGMP